jgi:hypothetical protein
MMARYFFRHRTLSIAVLVASILAKPPLKAVASPDSTSNAAVPVVSECKLETTQRVALRVDTPAKFANPVGVRVSFYDSKKVWLADEIITNPAIDAPILPVAGLFDPRQVVSVACAVDGYIPVPQESFVNIASGSVRGQKACTEQNGLNVDGGPDAYFAVAVLGRNWIMVQFSASISHFFPDQETEFNGDVFSASLDRGPEQNIVISGQDPQTLSYLFTDLSPGLHQIDYGPRATFDAVRAESPGYSRGYHNFCFRVTPT